MYHFEVYYETVDEVLRAKQVTTPYDDPLDAEHSFWKWINDSRQAPRRIVKIERATFLEDN